MKTIRTIRKWGMSYGISLRKDVVDREKFKEGELVSIEIKHLNYMDKDNIDMLAQVIADQEGLESVRIVGKKKAGEENVEIHNA